jgi:AcrR family transcriptional regulator
MADVKARAYVSPLRQQQAAASRRAVLAAARELFLEQGYGATTVDQVASRAGVSKPTVFSAVGNKQTLLKVVRDVAMAGDDEPLAVAERASARLALEEPDPHRAVDHMAAHITGLLGRYAAIDEVLRGAAESGGPGVRELWEDSERQRLNGAGFFVDALLRKGPLREGLSRRAAVDLLWLLMAGDAFHRLVHRRRWSVARYQAWLADSIRQQLLPPPA